MNKINIIHLITELNMGGAEQMLYKLVTRMNHDRFRCLVVSMTDKGPIGEKITQSGLPVVALGMGLGRPTLRGIAKLYHLLKQESTDIIQTWLYHADLLGLLVGRMAGVRRIVWGIRCSDMRLKKYSPLTALTVRLGGVLSPLVDAIVVNSREGRRIHKKRGYLTERMILIPNGFDTDEFRSDKSARGWLGDQLGLPQNAVVIGLVARFDPMKDQINFLKAASLVAQKDDRVHFIMAGRGVANNNRELTSFIDNNLQGRVHFLGVRNDIPRLMAALDIASSSSAFGEGFSNTIGEAMACGVPCVVTDVGDSAQIVGETGIVVPPNDHIALANALLNILTTDMDERKAKGEQARIRIIEKFELGIIVRRFEKFYESLILIVDDLGKS